MICCGLIACKKNSVSFTYTPDAPRAGQSVSFTNQSTSGEEWAWTFGDGITSTLKSPTHTYKKPGTYRVVLKVDKRAAWTATQEITVYDTVPSFSCSDSTLIVYDDYTFTALVYNPYSYTVKYEWSFPDEYKEFIGVVDTTMKKSKLTVYFKEAMDSIPVTLRVELNDEKTEVTKYFRIYNVLTNSVLVRTPEGDYRQRIFDARADKPRLDGTAAALLNVEQDTFQIYNGDTFRLSELQILFPELEGFHIAKRKIYYRADGLRVANIDGSYRVLIDSLDCPAMTLDMLDNRIYWANDSGVWYMPFVGSDNNRFVTTPVRLNSLQDAMVLAADTTER